MIDTIKARLGSVERTGTFTLGENVQVRAFWGHVLLDLREAVLRDGTTTIDVGVLMANVEIVVPPHVAVDSNIASFAGNVSDQELVFSAPRDTAAKRVRLVGNVRFGNCEVVTLGRGQPLDDIV